jgi:hypothetical protein
MVDQYDWGFQWGRSWWRVFWIYNDSHGFLDFVLNIENAIKNLDEEGIIRMISILGINDENINGSYVCRSLILYLNWNKPNVDILMEVLFKMGACVTCDIKRLFKLFDNSCERSRNVFIKYIDNTGSRNTLLAICIGFSRGTDIEVRFIKLLIRLGAKIHLTKISFDEMPSYMKKIMNKQKLHVDLIVTLLGIAKYRRPPRIDKNLFIKIAHILFYLIPRGL